MEACAFGEQAARQDGLLLKEISPVAAPVAYDWFNRHRPYIKRPRPVGRAADGGAGGGAGAGRLHRLPQGRPAAARRHAGAGERRRSCRRSTSWRGTTRRCAGSRSIRRSPTCRRSIPTSRTSNGRSIMFGDEMPMHIEMTRFDGKIVFSGLPIVRYTSEARLEEIIALHEANGCLVFNPHRYTLEEGGMKTTDRGQLEFKKQADPKGILNPGKMIAWDDPDFDFDSGRAWLFEGLQDARAPPDAGAWSSTPIRSRRASTARCSHAVVETLKRSGPRGRSGRPLCRGVRCGDEPRGAAQLSRRARATSRRRSSPMSTG